MKMTTYNQAYIKRGIWELWHDKTWDDYIYPFYKKKVLEFVEQEIEHNVLLYGDNGMGKSMLMNLAMKDYLHKGFEVYVIDFRHLVKEYTKSWRDDGKLAQIIKSDYLAIDDLGKEFQGGDVSKELAATALDYVLRYRFQRKLSTWMTFNMTLSEIGPSYTEHIASLIKRSSVAIAFEGEDYGNKLFKKIVKNG